MKQISIRLTEEEYETLRQYCFDERISITQHFRNTLPSKKKEERAKKIPYTEEEDDVDLKTLFE